jgi:general secretion pathway protein F
MRVIKVESTFQWQWQLPRRQAQLQITTFAQELVALLEAGLTITEAIDALAEREPDAAIRQMLGKIAAEMARGATFSEALENADGAFPRMLIASARSSERSGGLADALRRFAEYATTAEALGATVRASLV